MTTQRQRAAARRNLVKARAARAANRQAHLTKWARSSIRFRLGDHAADNATIIRVYPPRRTGPRAAKRAKAAWTSYLQRPRR